MTKPNKAISPIFNFAYGIYKSFEAQEDAEILEEFGERDWAVSQAQVNFFPLRFEEAMKNRKKFTKSLFKWIFTSREHTNYTLPMRSFDLDYIAAFVAAVAGIPMSVARGYIDELANDTLIPETIKQWVSANPHDQTVDTEVRYGKRFAWYALARARKPRTILETGIDKGLGSLVMCLALLKNQQETNYAIRGKYYGLDISPHAGFFLRAPFTEVGQILRGDSIESIQRFPDPIDFIICDSDHTEGYETREYQAAEEKFGSNAYILSDTAIYDPALCEYAKATGRNFLYCPEYTKDHWYPGDGVGVAWGEAIGKQ